MRGSVLPVAVCHEAISVVVLSIFCTFIFFFEVVLPDILAGRGRRMTCRFSEIAHTLTAQWTLESETRSCTPKQNKCFRDVKHNLSEAE